MCLEMGLHRRDAVLRAFHNEEDLVTVNKLFWSVYCLDRRWSIGTGLPFTIQDEDIDPYLPEPVSYRSLPAHRCGKCTSEPNCRGKCKGRFSSLLTGDGRVLPSQLKNMVFWLRIRRCDIN